MSSYFIGYILGTVIGAAVGALIGAVIIRFIAKLVVKFIPPFGMAYKATFFGGVVTYLIGFVFGFIVGASGNTLSVTNYILLTIIGFFVYAAILGSIIKHPETGSIGFGKACLISLVQFILVIIIGVAIFVLWY
ncbi:MAG: hypothetical protein LBS70_04745 [Candidatus Accumulibacter sp.]|jgi:hypothetical protein|nr:hypothetical protein [Accumulibacter sp.]